MQYLITLPNTTEDCGTIYCFCFTMSYFHVYPNKSLFICVSFCLNCYLSIPEYCGSYILSVTVINTVGWYSSKALDLCLLGTWYESLLGYYMSLFSLVSLVNFGMVRWNWPLLPTSISLCTYHSDWSSWLSGWHLCFVFGRFHDPFSTQRLTSVKFFCDCAVSWDIFWDSTLE